ncbi:BglG family transcription antiterminator [Thermoactinomyces intermedius]|jgi:transcriptional antiterminator/mannitol/fructose-specific phosphotransferase system IIA component (Ntr-type)|uniref:Ascorbate-specific PTS system EIIA component n=1 Tax=Thermoactinomyces intermedius TaxID=2024 RepID=A0A8I1A921_THEIN|nr:MULTISPECIES: BglG family transcription antiterminator [Thermoactinomyces]MBA4548286.1 BglG family transcription antiterminator [Thermoactinomyces intermedius]MBA4835150.1 BglG family transcription antiterminator [Thermoactinomyces intermedius]MBH8595130.1 BglG family transcription antiterminator [Thermoactinomyces intermedius]MBH8601933.1 BglG family transcription antiterminator [Thermoactinomyces sp. CICC 23799]
MQLDERCIRLLREIASRPGSSWRQLQERLGLSRRQITYDLEKINSWLKEENLPAIRYVRQHGFVIPSSLEEYLQRWDAVEHKNYVWTGNERVNMLLLSLLIAREPWSLVHVSGLLDVSRNTALADLKEARKKARKAGVNLIYSRADGYRFAGPEWKKRNLLRWLVIECIRWDNGEMLLNAVLDQDTGVSGDQVLNQLEETEQRLDIRYMDEHLNQLKYLLMFLIRRIEEGHRVRWPEKWDEIANTKAFAAAGNLLKKLLRIPLSDPVFRQEQAYIALLLLSGNIFSQADQPMHELAEKMIRRFEQIGCLYFSEKEQLASMIAMHLDPAYYRIKYGLTLPNPLKNIILEEHEALHFLVKKCAVPFEEKVGKPVPEDELAYLTMHFGGWLRRQGLELTNRPKAVVVCPNGIAISNLLTHGLRDLFPDILFLDAVTVREFFSKRYPCDLVFSTVYLRTQAKLFLIPPILTQEEKMRLRSEVSREIYGFSTNEEQILNIIEQYADIHDRAGLSKALASLFAQNHFAPSSIKESQKPMLNELITEQTIQLAKKADSWEDAIRLAAKPLVQKGCVKEQYVQAMIDSIHELGPYVVLAPKVAIPHARPDDGVHQLSMSFLRLEEGVLFPQQKKVHLLFVLAAVDSESHLLALAQLSEMLSDEAEIEKLIQAQTPEEVLQMIHQYSKGDGVS